MPFVSNNLPARMGVQIDKVVKSWKVSWTVEQLVDKLSLKFSWKAEKLVSKVVQNFKSYLEIWQVTLKIKL